MTKTIYYSYIDGPLGRLFVQGDGQFVTGLYMPQHKGWRGPEASWRRSDAPFAAVREQITEYFAGERKQFDVPLELAGTPFQRRVWQELQQIPFGDTITYAQLAQRVGKPTASRAVGHANGCNPISIVVPCHRVIGADGKLTGYAGGVDKKRWLLAWERCATLAEPGHLFHATETLTSQSGRHSLWLSTVPIVDGYSTDSSSKGDDLDAQLLNLGAARYQAGASLNRQSSV